MAMISFWSDSVFTWPTLPAPFLLLTSELQRLVPVLLDEPNLLAFLNGIAKIIHEDLNSLIVFLITRKEEDSVLGRKLKVISKLPSEHRGYFQKTSY
jgi:hypothetical protein